MADNLGLLKNEQGNTPLPHPYGFAQHCHHLDTLATGLVVYHAILNLGNAFFSISLAAE